MAPSSDPFDIGKLRSALEDVGVQLSWTLCQNFIANLVSEIPELQDHIDIINNVAVHTFHSADLSITIGSASKPSRNDAETCQKVLQSGANKGKKCSLSRIANSEYCKRHLNMVMKTNNEYNEEKKKQITSFRDVVGATKQQRRSPVELQLRPLEDMENIYVDLKTSLIFEEINDRIVAVGHLYDNDAQLLSKADVRTCDTNGWEYRLKE